MTDWLDFALYALQSIVSMVFDLDLGLGFSLGDLEVALLLIGIIAVALIVRIHHQGVRHDFNFNSESNN